ncbi:MAG: 23S rRNA (adenine(2030)-N(6))-methyltransferase RlmJ [Rhizomicrobium sp.]
MNYRHGYHAGNFADVVKHLALVAVIEHLARKDAAFVVIDSHAGRGRYALSSTEALKTGEARTGIARIRPLGGPALLERYLRLVEREGQGAYPGSPLIAARMLRPQDRLVAVEKEPLEALALKKLLRPFANARAEQGDGYARIKALLPPKERRGLILMDPPFEAPDEFESLGRAIRSALGRFATGTYLIWYPVKSEGPVAAFEGEALLEAKKALKLETAIGARGGKLDRAAFLIINPPFGFAAGMDEVLGVVAPAIAARCRLVPLKGGA